jgi:DNA-binding transcriptional LysR family regulator
MQEVQAIEEIARNSRKPHTGLLRLGLVHHLSPRLMPALVRGMRTLAPEMPVISHEGLSATLSEQLRDGAIDNMLLVLTDGGRLAAVEGQRSDQVFNLRRAIYSPCAVTGSDGCAKRGNVLGLDLVVGVVVDHNAAAIASAYLASERAQGAEHLGLGHVSAWDGAGALRLGLRRPRPGPALRAPRRGGAEPLRGRA